jgi:hypothetical protein
MDSIPQLLRRVSAFRANQQWEIAVLNALASTIALSVQMRIFWM